MPTPPHPQPSKRALQAHLRAGLSYREIGQHYGASDKPVQRWLRLYGLNDLPKHEVEIKEAAVELGLSLPATYGALRRSGIALGNWGGRRTVKRSDLKVLVVHRSIPHTDTRPEGYVTAAEQAALNRVTATTLRGQLYRAGIRPDLWLYRPRGRTALYLPQTVARLAPPPSPRECPRGYLTSAQVREMCGLSKSGLMRWARRGAPFTVGYLSGKPRFWHPLKLAEWIEATMQLDYARNKARPLRRYLAQLEQAAA